MERVHSLLSAGCPYPMLLQGRAPKPVLLDAFQSTPSVLFASASFWEGVDVPGEALSLVVLDKLPFASPTHPWSPRASRRWRRRARAVLQLPAAGGGARAAAGLRTASSGRGPTAASSALLDVGFGRKAYGRQLLCESAPGASVQGDSVR
jgi:ATP-dependent DNA helicase DinG